MVALPLSVFIITQNEADRIARTIDSVRALSDDIVVVDSGSTDETVRVARAHGARVMHNDWPGFGPQKRFAEDQCRHDWVLNLDADEVVTPALAAEIASLFRSGAPALRGYRIRMPTVYPHQDRPRLWAEAHTYIRLYDRRAMRFPDHPTRDAITPELGEPVGQLMAPALHYSVRDLAHLVDKTNRYTSAQAAGLKQKSRAALLIRMVFEFPIAFFKAYVLRRNFTGGAYGLAIAVTYAYSRFLKAAKMYERHLMERV